VPGQHADLVIWNIARPADLVHGMGAAPLHARIWSGK
jgi:imidazolonepropionase